MDKFLLFFSVGLIFTGLLNAQVEGSKRNSNLRVGRPGGEKFKTSSGELERWFTQRLDHFNSSNTITWKQRYYVNEEFFDNKTGKTAFLLIGGEEEAYEEWMKIGAWYIYAQEFKPILFQLEHRFYGQSHPTGDISLENLTYLSSQQALGDLAAFVESMNKQYNLPSDVKWIAFGGSYSGSLAAWLRQRYPNLVHGAVSSSSVLKAQVNYSGYFEIVQEALRTVSEKCVAAVSAATAQVDKLMLSSEGKKTIDKKFKLCDKIEEANALDVDNFYFNLANYWAGIVQYNHGNTAFNEEYNLTTEQFCGVMTNESIGTEIDRLAAINDIMMPIYGEECNSFNFKDSLEGMKSVNWEDVTSRQWRYQECNEFGFFQTSDYKPQIFGNKLSVDYSLAACKEVYGEKYTLKFLNDAVDRTNKFYGGLDINVTNVVFVQGSLDPWHKLGITQTRDKDAPAIFIKGASHCMDVYKPMRADSPELKAARVQIKNYIATWLK